MIGGDDQRIGEDVAGRYAERAIRDAAPLYHLAGRLLGILAVGIFWGVVLAVIAATAYGVARLVVLTSHALLRLVA